jgi:hypothetical protein
MGVDEKLKSTLNKLSSDKPVKYAMCGIKKCIFCLFSGFSVVLDSSRHLQTALDNLNGWQSGFSQIFSRASFGIF